MVGGPCQSGLGIPHDISRSCISFLCDAGRGHFDVSDRTAEYIALFVKKAMQARLPEDASEGHVQELKKVRPEDGWLAERWHPVQPRRAKAAPFAEYRGDVHDAFWYFDREMQNLRKPVMPKNVGRNCYIWVWSSRGVWWDMTQSGMSRPIRVSYRKQTG